MLFKCLCEVFDEGKNWFVNILIHVRWSELQRTWREVM